jgi:hypothetical protein
MTLNEEKGPVSAEVSILGTLVEDDADESDGCDKKDSAMPSSWAVWSTSMKYPWNPTQKNHEGDSVNATYGVLASSVSISQRNEDDEEIPQFEIDFSGVTPTQTYYDLIYKTAASLIVKDEKREGEVVEFLEPKLPVTVRIQIEKNIGSEDEAGGTRLTSSIVYDKNHTVIGRTVTEAKSGDKEPVSRLLLNPVTGSEEPGENIEWIAPLPFDETPGHSVYNNLGDDANRGIRSCLAQVKTLDRRRTIPVECSKYNSLSTPQGLYSNVATFAYDSNLVDDAIEALAYVKALADESKEEVKERMVAEFKESQDFNKSVPITAFWPSPLMKPGLKVWIFFMSLISGLTALYMATAEVHGLGISTVGPECARREFFTVQFVMWAILIPLLLLIVTNLHTCHTCEMSNFISHIDYGALIAGVIMVAGGYTGTQLKAEAKNSTFCVYLVSLLAYAFIWQHLNKKDLRDVVGSKLVRCWLGLYVIVWLVSHLTAVDSKFEYKMTADVEVVLTTIADLALFAMLPICVLDALLAAEAENSEHDGTLAQMANRWKARARFVASFFRFVFGVFLFASGFPWCLGLFSVFARFKKLFIGKLGYNCDRLQMNPDTASDAPNNPAKVEAEYNEQMRDTWMVIQVDKVWKINEQVGKEKELNNVVVQKHSAFDVLMLPIIGLGWPINMSIFLYYLFSIEYFEWTDLRSLDSKVIFMFAWSVGVWLYLCYVSRDVMTPTAGLMTYDLPRASFQTADKFLNKFDIDIRDSDKPQETFYWMPVLLPLVLAQIAFFFYGLQADDTHELSCNDPAEVHGKPVCEAPMFWDVDGVSCCTTEVPGFDLIGVAINVIAQILGAFTGLQIWANLLLYGDKVWFFEDGFTSRLADAFQFKLKAHDATAIDAFEFNLDSDALVADGKGNITIDVVGSQCVS